MPSSFDPRMCPAGRCHDKDGVGHVANVEVRVLRLLRQEATVGHNLAVPAAGDGGALHGSRRHVGRGLEVDDGQHGHAPSVVKPLNHDVSAAASLDAFQATVQRHLVVDRHGGPRHKPHQRLTSNGSPRHRIVPLLGSHPLARVGAAQRLAGLGLRAVGLLTAGPAPRQAGGVGVGLGAVLAPGSAPMVYAPRLPSTSQPGWRSTTGGTM
jgi:hypothetical protein